MTAVDPSSGDAAPSGTPNGAAAPEARIKKAPTSGDAFVPKPSPQFVVTPAVERVTRRALAYLDAGYPVHLNGPAGTGKTSLAFHVAAQWGRPAVLLHGDDELGRSDLVGGEVGYRKSRVVDNYIRSVLKTSEQVTKVWADNRLLKACREGYTLIYDEFSRSRPEANNVLLSILEERILNLPSRQSGEGYVRVHPKFRAIFTSNTEEYAGTHKTQDALLDRLITIDLDYHDRDTEVAIVEARAGIEHDVAAKIVDLMRAVRRIHDGHHGPSVRAALVLARVVAPMPEEAQAASRFFRDMCHDVLRPPRSAAPDAARRHRTRLDTLIDAHFGR
jgi:gas vesicle protein GvpN